jgi:asparagine synthase (glutamine-hydrolysing)
VSRGLDRLGHRGPDGRGEATVGEAVHGHVRLSLLDLTDAGAQPWREAGGTLTFVGEVWNHADLRDELELEGCTFRSATDTEALAKLLSRDGPEETLEKIDGMFAFAWSDGRGGHWLARDGFGKVPLHVVRRGRAFEWSSERKAWDRGGEAVDLPPGSLLDLTTGRLATRSTVPGLDATKTVDPAAVLNLLRSGVRRRLAADAPTCVLCSGGLDSAAILALAAEARPDVAAFHAFLDRRSTDLAAARRLCSLLGVRLTEVPIAPPTRRSLADAVRAAELDSKVQCEIGLACTPLARAIKAEGFKACLSGEASDELFGGYGNSICMAAAGSSWGRKTNDLEWVTHRRRLLARMASGNFARCNKSFMAGGVECRLPFMERGLVELALSLGLAGCPPGKLLLKESLRGLLPAWVIERDKETFQGGAGISAAAEAAVGDVRAFCRAEWKRTFLGGRSAGKRVPEGQEA